MSAGRPALIFLSRTRPISRTRFSLLGILKTGRPLRISPFHHKSCRWKTFLARAASVYVQFALLEWISVEITLRTKKGSNREVKADEIFKSTKSDHAGRRYSAGSGGCAS